MIDAARVRVERAKDLPRRPGRRGAAAAAVAAPPVRALQPGHGLRQRLHLRPLPTGLLERRQRGLPTLPARLHAQLRHAGVALGRAAHLHERRLPRARR